MSEILEPVLRSEAAAVLGGPVVARLHIEPSPKKAVGDVRADLRPLVGGRAVSRDECAAVAERLTALDIVEHAVGIPPRVYLRLLPTFLAECVTEAVLEARERHGGAAGQPSPRLVISYSDPNLNKPLHVGHLRNNFLGMAISNLLEARGWIVERQASHLNWGFDIAKTLVAYRRWGGGATPETAGMKGDHFVGQFYVMFHERDEGPRTTDEPADESTDKTWDDVAGAYAGRTDLEREALEVLRLLDGGDPELTELNVRLTAWAEEGILQTYERIGTRMDALYYEGDHLAEGRALVEELWSRGLLHRRPDGSAAVDLSDAGLGDVTFLRADGTPLIYRQWMATDIHRFAGRDFDRVLFLFGREWEDGFAIFRQVLGRLGHEWVDRVRMPGHGMVSLPEGPMQSRSGNVVTADDLLDRLQEEFMHRWPDRAPWPLTERAKACERLAVALLKYAFLRAPRAHDVAYDEERLWRHVWPRLAAVLRALAWCEDGSRAAPEGALGEETGEAVRSVALLVDAFPDTVARATEHLDPVLVVRLLDDLARTTETGSRIGALDPRLRETAAVVMRRALGLLNIKVPDGLDALVPPSPRAKETLMLQYVPSCAPELEETLEGYFGSAFGPDLDDLHREFKDGGYARFPDFAPRPVAEAVKGEVMELLEHHAKRREIHVPSTGNTPRFYESVGRDDIVEEARVIPAFFRSPAFIEFLSGLAGETVVPVPYEPEEILITRMTQPGDNHGWHWDDYSFSFCWLMESPPEGAGGATELVPNTHWDKDDPRIEHYLATREVISRHHPAGTAYFLRADTTMHRVTPIEEGTTRIVLVMSYATLADLDREVSHETIETIYT